MYNMRFSALSGLNYRLLLVLMASSGIPLVYSTLRIHFLGTLPDVNGLTIAAQIVWLNAIYEVLNESVLLSLFFILGQVVHDQEQLSHRVSVSFTIFILCYVLLTLLVVLFADIWVSHLGQIPQLQAKTVQYIRLEALAMLVSSCSLYCNTLLIVQKKAGAMYLLLGIKAVLMGVCDSVFVSQFPISLKLGVNGVAWSNLMVNGLLACGAVYFIRQAGLTGMCYSTEHHWKKHWFSIAFKSGLESFVRNGAFIVMISKLLNEVQKSDLYWQANQFIWGWLLLPILSIGQLIKQDVAEPGNGFERRFTGYFLLTTMVILLWFGTIPLWETFIHNVMGLHNSIQIIGVILTMIGFYVVFSYNNIIDSYFYGIGRTDLMLYQSLVVNILYYGFAYLCYQLGCFSPSLMAICYLFGLGIIVDAVITGLLYLRIKYVTSDKCS